METWVRLVAYAALLFSPMSLFEKPQFRLVLVFCLPVIAITSMLGFAKWDDLLSGLQVIAEPILCVWFGASLAYTVVRLSRLHR